MNWITFCSFEMHKKWNEIFFFDSKFSKIAFEIQEFLMGKWNVHFMLIFLEKLWRKFIKSFEILTVYNSENLMIQLSNILRSSELKNKIGKQKSLSCFPFCGINKICDGLRSFKLSTYFPNMSGFSFLNASKFFLSNNLETKQIHEIMKRNIAVTGRWQKQRCFWMFDLRTFLLFGYLWVVWFEITTFGSFNFCGFFCWNINRKKMNVIWVI